MTGFGYEDLSMDTLMEIHECMGCEVLAKHMIRANQLNLEFGNLLLDEEANNIEFDFDKLKERVADIDERKRENLIGKLNGFDVYGSDYESLSIRYGFPREINEECLLYLNYAAYLYLTRSSQIWLKRALPAFEDKLEKLIKAAGRFEYFVNSFDDCGDEYNQFFDGYTFKQTISDTKAKLDDIKNLKEKLRSSTIGRIAKLHDHRPMGNLGLHEFVKLMWNFWHEFLGRSIVQKHDGINGRKQLLEFLVDCLEPIHPTLVDGHVIDGPVDNALKKFQRNLNLLEKHKNLG